MKPPSMLNRSFIVSVKTPYTAVFSNRDHETVNSNPMKLIYETQLLNNVYHHQVGFTEK